MKKDDQKYYKLILFVAFVGLLFLPILQKRFHIIHIPPLLGAIKTPKTPTISTKKWFDGSYQSKKNDQIEKTIGFRPFFVRTHNQLQYSLFNKIYAKDVIVGKKGYMYEKQYITSYLGQDFIGADSIQQKVNMLAKINDTLQKLNIKLIVMIAPGKGAFYPNYFPRKYDSIKRDTTNYQIYRKDLAKTTIHTIDFQRWFLMKKGKTKYPLYSKRGIHWSYYAEVYVGDSIMRYMQYLFPNYQLPKMEITGVESSNIPRHRDGDIGDGTNLFYTGNKTLVLGYPKFKLTGTSGKHPKTLVIADSFYWGLFNWGMSRDVFDNGQFWYYNKEIYPNSYKKKIFVKDIDVQKEIEKNKAIILLSTSGNLYKFAFGFINQVYNIYFPDSP